MTYYLESPDVSRWEEVNESKSTMNGSSYSLLVRKSTFCAVVDLLPHMRQATPDETGSWQTTKVAAVKGCGPELAEYRIKKRFAESKKDQQILPLGRVLTLKDGTSIVFHKMSNWQMEVRNAAGEVIDRCKRGDTKKTLRSLFKHHLLRVYPHYEGFIADLFAYMILTPDRNFWMDFARIGKKRLNKLCDKDEKAYLFWDFGNELYFFQGDVELYSAPDSALYWFSRAEYLFDADYFQKEGKGDWLWLHEHMNDQKLKLELRLAPDCDEFFEDLLSSCGALEIVFKASKDYEESWELGSESDTGSASEPAESNTMAVAE